MSWKAKEMLGKIAVMIFEECKPDTCKYYLNVSTENPSKINHLLLREKMYRHQKQ